MNESLIFEVSVNNNKSYVLSFYQSPSQTSDYIEAYLANLENLIFDIPCSRSDFVLLIGGFNLETSQIMIQQLQKGHSWIL